ncbi:MAG: NAD(P)/FAD-dependent oxidoreductase, partial [Candidatus Latescibacteria bacterium]|nr:NAD(P)/FAD-dependent oxidoreductase [Candidatus Latescibacterota bacterium]
MSANNKKIIIIGAGPAGLFAAFKLSSIKNFNIKIFDKGGNLIDRLKNKSSVCGLGGAGLFSDGKLNFTPLIGTNLLEVISEEKIKNLINETEKIFVKYCQNEFKETSEAWQNKISLEKKAIKIGVKFLPYRGAHIGSDVLPPIIEKMRKDLEKNGVEFFFNQEIERISKNKIYFGNQQEDFDYLILAPGRGGTFWLEKIVKDLGIEYKYNPLDIGVRVETSAEIMEEVCSVEYDPKFYIKTKTYEDTVRTFCTCPRGFVTSEKHKDSSLVNGYSNYQYKSNNTNFAFLVKVRLTEPLENTNLF